jgi:hypothetical protein
MFQKNCAWDSDRDGSHGEGGECLWILSFLCYPEKLLLNAGSGSGIVWSARAVGVRRIH